MANGQEKSFWERYGAIIVGAIGLVLVVGQWIYFGYYARQDSKIEQLTSQLGHVREELRREEAIPKITIIPRTLSPPGADDPLIASLPAVPASVEVRHVGGGTARGIVLDIFASDEILDFEPWETAEGFEVDRIESDRKGLRLKAERLRPGARIGLTLMTAKPASLETTVLMEEGKAAVGTGLGEDLLSQGLRPGDIRLETKIGRLESQISELQNESLFDWFGKQLPSPLLLSLLAVAVGVMTFVYSITKQAIRVISARRRRSRETRAN